MVDSITFNYIDFGGCYDFILEIEFVNLVIFRQNRILYAGNFVR